MRIVERLPPHVRWRIERWIETFRSRPKVVAASGVAIVGAVAIVVIASLGTGSRLATRVPMVDVRTGDVFWLSVASRAIAVPAPHPESGERTLVGAERMPDGMWRILPHDLELVASIGGSVSPRIDRGTGAVRSEPEVDR